MSSISKAQAAATFKDRVAQFWNWYPTVAEQLFDAIENGRLGDLTSEVEEFMDNVLPGMYWVFGPGENGGHSFTVTGEGDLPKQLLAEYWHSRAIEIPNWTFHGSKQGVPLESLKGMAIQLGEQEQVDVENFLLKTCVDEESQLIDVVAWHPSLALVPDEHHMQILFLLLDEALGEFGTQTWLGEIKAQPFVADGDTRPLFELPEFIEQVNKYYQWENLSPLKSYTGYQVPEQRDTRRGDTVVGVTCVPNLVFDLLENKGRLPEDPLEGMGAEFAFLAIDGSVFPEGKQSDVRANIEDALSDALVCELSGRTLGGAFGLSESYIDLLLFDGDNSRRVVLETLKELQLHGRSRLESFV